MYSPIVIGNKEVTMSQTVNVRTYHVVVDAPAEAVFDFVQDVTNLPLWAVHFCTDVRVVDDGAMVQSPSGELYFGTTGDRDVGVVDWWCGPTMHTAERWPTRVVGLPDGRSLYQVTATLESATGGVGKRCSPPIAGRRESSAFPTGAHCIA